MPIKSILLLSGNGIDLQCFFGLVYKGERWSVGTRNKALRDFSALHPQAATALQEWRKKIEATTSQSYAELKTVFNSVDKAGHYYIFDSAGNHFRLIAAIHFNTQTVYIRAAKSMTYGNLDRPYHPSSD